jgi:hypothetical protein
MVADYLESAQLIDFMARLERFELPTFWFVARHSIQLSYRRAETQIRHRRNRVPGAQSNRPVLPILPGSAGRRSYHTQTFDGTCGPLRGGWIWVGRADTLGPLTR